MFIRKLFSYTRQVIDDEILNRLYIFIPQFFACDYGFGQVHLTNNDEITTHESLSELAKYMIANVVNFFFFRGI